MIVFGHPWLLLLWAVPLAIGYLLPPYREVRTGIRAPFLRRVARLLDIEPSQGSVIPNRARKQRIVVGLVWIGLVAAAARPQWIGAPIEKQVPTRDLLLAVDLSGSMETKDFTNQKGQRIPRLDAVKEVLDDFLSRREGDRVGLIFFGSAAFVQAPFTEDLAVCRELLGEARVRMAGPQTVLGDAIGLAMNVFKSSDVKDKVLIVLTDGNDTGSKVPPREAAAIAKDLSVKIHTIAIGDPAAAGEEAIDEKVLEDMATSTGGRWFRGADLDDLESINRELNRIETREVTVLSHRPRSDLFQWPLAVSILMSMGYHLWMQVAWRSRRQTSSDRVV